MKKKLQAFLAGSFIGAGILVALLYGSALASGGGCEDAQAPDILGTQNSVSFSTPGGQVVGGVCIKSGINMFSGGHSGQLTDGTYENGCYTVAGVGTSTVSVVRNFESNQCQGISHIDVYFQGPTPTPTPSPTPTPAPTPTPTPSPTPSPTSTPTPTVVPQVFGLETLPATGGGLFVVPAALGLIGAGLLIRRRFKF